MVHCRQPTRCGFRSLLPGPQRHWNCFCRRDLHVLSPRPFPSRRFGRNTTVTCSLDPCGRRRATRRIPRCVCGVRCSSGQWTIGNDAVRYSVRLERRGAVRFEGLSIGDARDSVTLSDEPDALVTLDGETVHLGAVGSGFVLEQVGLDRHTLCGDGLEISRCR